MRMGLAAASTARRRTKAAEVRLATLTRGTSRQRHEPLQDGSRTLRADHHLTPANQLFEAGVAGGAPVGVDRHSLSLVEGQTEVKPVILELIPHSRRAVASS